MPAGNSSTVRARPHSRRQKSPSVGGRSFSSDVKWLALNGLQPLRKCFLGILRNSSAVPKRSGTPGVLTPAVPCRSISVISFTNFSRGLLAAPCRMHPCGRRSATTGLPLGATASSPGTVPISNGVSKPSWARKPLTSMPENSSISPGNTATNSPASWTGPPSAVASCAAAPDPPSLPASHPAANDLSSRPECRAFCGTQWRDRDSLSSCLGARGFKLLPS